MWDRNVLAPPSRNIEEVRAIHVWPLRDFGYLETRVNLPKILSNFYNGYPFLPESQA